MTEPASHAPDDRIAVVEVEHGLTFRSRVPDFVTVVVGDRCVLECEKVLESGRVVSLKHPAADEAGDVPRSVLLRRAEPDDVRRAEQNVQLSGTAYDACEAAAARHKLALHLVRVRYSFDRLVLSVTFTADDRVDFWPMVRDLNHELHVRVEMRQVGVRDETALIGGLGPCGRATCCCTWMKRFESINVRMAKTQNLSLNPVAISGNCGRLKCCLKYEADQYRDLMRNLPAEGSLVKTPGGDGQVTAVHPLTGRVTIRFEDQRSVDYDAGDVQVVGGKPRKAGRQQHGKTHPDGKRTQPQSPRHA
ncbi:MAG: hypothetical protein A2498_04365 [Lentisphaerae bacterium RIFOXYC12_FULL_60_16]|nr:MAG: hypothetical protein A2498_04365 [Lentisphaerae bacterium RIFOXYC12_FULL_60_16]OGV75255.1 MAG: hypothetical protein A2269_01730 [Lentisphaerae bacterium RIFOXYA12_FULL_60_10]OGV85544.1 MAG: hypothetical protein A2340_12635 [Lentisphaerae bacterium RIFOXYB12_FULL_60_10]